MYYLDRNLLEKKSFGSSSQSNSCSFRNQSQCDNKLQNVISSEALFFVIFSLVSLLCLVDYDICKEIKCDVTNFISPLLQLSLALHSPRRCISQSRFQTVLAKFINMIEFRPCTCRTEIIKFGSLGGITLTFVCRWFARRSLGIRWK